MIPPPSLLWFSSSSTCFLLVDVSVVVCPVHQEAVFVIRAHLRVYAEVSGDDAKEKESIIAGQNEPALGMRRTGSTDVSDKMEE